MSRETWEIVQESGIKNVEIQLALQCAPLIAGLKISNLFQISIEDYIQVLKILKNSRIMIYPLGVKGNTIALLLYRKRSLEGYLDQEKVKELLKEFGYSCTSLKEILVTFRKHYQEYLQKNVLFHMKSDFCLVIHQRMWKDLSGTMGRSSYVSGNGRYMKIQRQSRSFSRNMTIPGKT